MLTWKQDKTLGKPGIHARALEARGKLIRCRLSAGRGRLDVEARARAVTSPPADRALQREEKRMVLVPSSEWKICFG